MTEKVSFAILHTLLYHLHTDLKDKFASSSALVSNPVGSIRMEYLVTVSGHLGLESVS